MMARNAAAVGRQAIPTTPVRSCVVGLALPPHTVVGMVTAAVGSKSRAERTFMVARDAAAVGRQSHPDYFGGALA